MIQPRRRNRRRGCARWGRASGRSLEGAVVRRRARARGRAATLSEPVSTTSRQRQPGCAGGCGLPGRELAALHRGLERVVVAVGALAHPPGTHRSRAPSGAASYTPARVRDRERVAEHGLELLAPPLAVPGAEAWAMAISGRPGCGRRSTRATPRAARAAATRPTAASSVSSARRHGGAAPADRRARPSRRRPRRRRSTAGWSTWAQRASWSSAAAGPWSVSILPRWRRRPSSRSFCSSCSGPLAPAGEVVGRLGRARRHGSAASASASGARLVGSARAPLRGVGAPRSGSARRPSASARRGGLSAASERRRSTSAPTSRGSPVAARRAASVDGAPTSRGLVGRLRRPSARRRPAPASVGRRRHGGRQRGRGRGGGVGVGVRRDGAGAVRRASARSRRVGARGARASGRSASSRRRRHPRRRVGRLARRRRRRRGDRRVRVARGSRVARRRSRVACASARSTSS